MWVLYSLFFAVSLVYVINKIKGEIVSEVQVVVDEITAVLVKAKGEIVAEIASLEEALKAGVTPDLTALKAVADSLDAIVPDEVVVEEPVEEPVEEVPAEAV